MISIFRKHKIVLCSRVSGQLLINGLPANKVRVRRILTYSGEQEFSDSTVTDSEGCFSLAKYSILSRKPNKPFFDSFTHQYIYAEFDGNKPLIWFAKHRGKDELDSFAKKLGNIIGDLTDPEVQFEFDSGVSQVKYFANSRCRWDADFKVLEVFQD
ncbi:DUF6795 domain-containing protein [Pseudoalteromonas sp. CNC9-20]|uniref:DUF6795 domain-containing protein n=1 Tax=Pseudoalteromonas sp. CNC9-20 TaxID=2917750 RepID=UPI0031BB901C